MNLKTIYEDEQILILNKPAGMVVNRADSVKDKTIQDWAEKQEFSKKFAKNWVDLVPDDFNNEFGSPEEIFQQRLGMVHRLDKDTSGVLVWAKNPGSLVSLLHQFKTRQTKKKYVCLVHGKLPLNSDQIDAPIKRSKVNPGRFEVSPEGRTALTKYKVGEYYPHLNVEKVIDDFIAGKKDKPVRDFRKLSKTYQGFSLLEVWPQTGRTHQIRVHMTFLRHPLVGDNLYSGKKRSRIDQVWCPRQFLHASEIQIMHPLSHENMIFQAELSEDLNKTLEYLEKS